MTGAIKAIPTKHHGVLFRSRTEARWAVFFDELRIGWEYEREGYALPSGRYLPDFWLPTVRGDAAYAANEMGVWFEVKGTGPTDREKRLGTELRIATGHQAFIAPGPPFDPADWPERAASIQTEWPYGWRGSHWWTICPRCSCVGITLFGDTCDLCACNDGQGYGDRGRSDVILAAVDAARSARFGT